MGDKPIRLSESTAESIITHFSSLSQVPPPSPLPKEQAANEEALNTLNGLATPNHNPVLGNAQQTPPEPRSQAVSPAQSIEPSGETERSKEEGSIQGLLDELLGRIDTTKGDDVSCSFIRRIPA